jgi:hypothetical protein
MHKHVILTISALGFVAGCAEQPVPTPLSKAADAPYRTLVTKYHDEDSPWQPFKLEIATESRPSELEHVLFAEQCENVGVIQTPRTIYIFYDELVLREFGSFTYQPDEPRPLLCDLKASLCAEKRDALIRDGAKLSKVCPSKLADGRPAS